MIVPDSRPASTPSVVSLYREALRLLRPYWPLALVATAMGVVSGFATARLLATLNDALHADHTNLPRVLLSFGALCALVLVGETMASVGNSLVGQRVIASLRKEVVARIATAPIFALQAQQAHRLLTTLSHDVDTISAFTFNLSGFLVSLAVTLGCLGYLAMLSGSLFLLVLMALALGLGANYAAGRTWMKSYEKVREAQDELQKGYTAITEGAKELRLSQPRRARVHRQQLLHPIDAIRDHKIVAMRAFWTGRAFAGTLFFVILGALVALGDRFALDRSVLSGFALVLLYVKGPLEQVVGELPSLGQAHVAFRRVAEMSARLATPEPHLLIDGPAVVAPAPGAIELRAVTYAFPSVGEATAAFRLGPIDLTIRPGETLFITGENGCGKTTLLMLLLGLYAPSSGDVLLGGTPVTDGGRDAYRQLFSAVFFDYLLFAELIVPPEACRSFSAGEVPAVRAQRLIQRLDLAQKVTIVGGADGAPLSFSTIELSAGQRKRLALVQACLEDRPILVFDEWAAEQDPTFRRIFYTEILPELKREGRTLLVISHDDRYFDVADRRITLRAGQLAVDSGEVAFVAAASPPSVRPSQGEL